MHTPLTLGGASFYLAELLMKYVLDIECYRNYFLMVFMPIDGTRHFTFEKHNDVVTVNDIDGIDWNATFITFNGTGYDYPMWGALWALKSNSELKDVSDAIIQKNLMPWDVEREFAIKIPHFDHIDIIQVLPLTGSLKIYGGRIGSQRLQDLPLDPSALISNDDAILMRKYCLNDCIVTGQLYNKIKPQIALRITMGNKYNLDLRSKSDAQIAEAVFASEFIKIAGYALKKPGINTLSFKYTPPPFIKFESEQLNTLLREVMKVEFKIKPDNGQLILPDFFKTPIVIRGQSYSMGLGGLHSVDKPLSVYSTNDYTIYDIDAAAYYPFIILNSGYHPAHMGDAFLKIYKEMVDARIRAKKTGDKVADATIKILINGSFGKLGSMYSKLYSPDMLFHTTITGQLCLLMLIEKAGMNIISANTDGIMVAVPKRGGSVIGIVSDWEELTGFTMEWTEYKSVHRRDVNNYFAIKPDGSVKVKGVFAESGLSKNPSNRIIYEAVIAHFKSGTPVSNTVRNCTDIGKFLTLRTVRGGAKCGDKLLGKSVRWYHSWLSIDTIQYQKNDTKVPLSEDAVVLEDLPDKFPSDVYYGWYVNEADKLIGMMK